jgi:hypothetical protein
MPKFDPFARMRRRSLTLLAAAALTTASFIVPGSGVAETFQCELGKSKVRVEGGRISRTTDQEFRDVPFTEIRFTQGGTKPGCVVIQFSGAAYAGKDRIMWIHAVLDAEATQARTILPPGNVPFAGNDDEFVNSDAVRPRTFSFAARGIAPGEYTARVQWKSLRGGAVFMHERITIVQHQ